MNRVFIFPGQGSQRVGMGYDLCRNFSVAKNLFEEVDEALSFKLSDIIFHGPEEELVKTYNTQPALMAVSMALIKILESEFGKKISELCSVVAGHSLGQYSAICAAGGISIADCAKLLRLRGEFMQNACAEGDGGMAAIIGAKPEIIKSVLNEAAKDGACEIANDNSEEQIVISGHVKAIDKAIFLFKEMQVRAIKLKVSAPFHSSLMKPAAEKMKEEIADIKFSRLHVPVIDNVSLEITDDMDFLKEKLVEQISGAVRWRETMQIIAANYDGAYEIGSGNVLTNLFLRSYTNFTAKAINNKEDFANLL